MYDCLYKLGGTELTRDEIRNIWTFYEQFLLDEQIWNKIKDDYGATEFSKFEQVIADIAFSYEKCRQFGCDEIFSMEEAFVDHNEEIQRIIKS